MADGSLNGRRVLVVEDEYFLAVELDGALQSKGAVVIGPVASVKDALALLEGGTVPDIAVLDMNLRGESASPVADMLLGKGIPFLFTTGYDRTSLSERHAGVSRLEKPVEATVVVRELEYLEAEFYRTALAQPGLIPAQYGAVFTQIAKHETEHVEALRTVLGLAAVPKPAFDFTGRGKYADVFSNFRTFATLSQTFEDTGVAAYMGQAGNLMGNGLILTTALRIHSVEGRHAAEVRRVRGQREWPSGAFDQPMSKAQVLAAVTPFIAG